jgi:arabinose-5-phosphate isomerase
VVVTDGEAGCAIASDDFEGRVAAPAIQVHDTTGAGDAFLGGLLAGLHHGLSWEDAGRLGNACGAACAEKLGAFPEDAASARSRVLALYEGPALSLGELPVNEIGANSPAEEALAVLDVAIEEMTALRGRLSADVFEKSMSLIRSAEAAGGRVHVTGIGKPEHVAHYVASLLSSTGTPATFLHATEAVHGSTGQVVPGDVVIAISNSGETRELRHAVETVRGMNARVIGVTGNPDSWLATQADAFLDAGVAREGGALGLAPRASVAAEVLVLAALGAALEKEKGFSKADYNLRHPAGKLGELSKG